MDATRNDARAQDMVKLAGGHGVRIITVDAQRLDGLTGNARHQGVAHAVNAGKFAVRFRGDSLRRQASGGQRIFWLEHAHRRGHVDFLWHVL